MEINDDEFNDIVDNTRNTLNLKIHSIIRATLTINEFNDFQKYISTKSLSFMKCIVNNADIQYSIIILHLNSNTHLLPMDYKSIKELNYLYFNDEMKKILKSKCLEELSGLPVNYTAEEKNVFFEEIHRQLDQNT